MAQLPFSQIDVFAASDYRGNPVAVVHSADSLSYELMAAFARWTNLSETTFLLTPKRPEADYRLRIFTPGGELPFAGHPTLGSCFAWLQSGGVPKNTGVVLQECDAGLITVRQLAGKLAFAAPPLLRTGALDPSLRTQLCEALELPQAAVVADQWIDNGPGWCALLLDSAERVLSCQLDPALAGRTPFGVIGPNLDGVGSEGTHDFEVRAFVPYLGVPEDPVTGSLNAGLAQWLIGSGIAPPKYKARQGTAIGRNGVVLVEQEGDDIWVGGSTSVCISGSAHFPTV